MNYSFNILWRILLDRKTTKAEMRKKVWIIMIMLTMVGKDDLVSINTLPNLCST